MCSNSYRSTLPFLIKLPENKQNKTNFLLHKRYTHTNTYTYMSNLSALNTSVIWHTHRVTHPSCTREKSFWVSLSTVYNTSLHLKTKETKIHRSLALSLNSWPPASPIQCKSISGIKIRIICFSHSLGFLVFFPSASLWSLVSLYLHSYPGKNREAKTRGQSEAPVQSHTYTREV